MDKIKAFFQNKWTQGVCWVLLALCVIFLILGGATVETISSGVALAGGIISAIALFVVFVGKQIKK